MLGAIIAVPKMPWFPMYPDRWLMSQSVRLMTYEQRGIYHELLCMAWRDGSIPEDTDDIAALLGIDRDRMEAAWKRVGKMFQPGDDGRLINGWQEDIRSEQCGKKEAAIAKATAAAKRWGNRPGQPAPTDEPIAATPPVADAFVAMLPESHQTPEMVQAVRGFFWMRSECKYTAWKPQTLETKAKEYAGYPVAVIIAALKHSASNQYQGVFPKKFGDSGGGAVVRLTTVPGGRGAIGSVAGRKAELLAERQRRGLVHAV